MPRSKGPTPSGRLVIIVPAIVAITVAVLQFVPNWFGQEKKASAEATSPSPTTVTGNVTGSTVSGTIKIDNSTNTTVINAADNHLETPTVPLSRAVTLQARVITDDKGHHFHRLKGHEKLIAYGSIGAILTINNLSTRTIYVERAFVKTKLTDVRASPIDFEKPVYVYDGGANVSYDVQTINLSDGELSVKGQLRTNFLAGEPPFPEIKALAPKQSLYLGLYLNSSDIKVLSDTFRICDVVFYLQSSDGKESNLSSTELPVSVDCSGGTNRIRDELVVDVEGSFLKLRDRFSVMEQPRKQ
jgi:hypothetical protein